MPRTQPSKKIDILGKPDSIPLYDVDKFTDSRLACTLFSQIKIPPWDSVGDSLEDFYISAKMEHNTMMTQKAALLEQQNIQKIRNKIRIRRLYQNQAKLRTRFVEVNVFLRDFDEKRKLALKKGNAELEIQRAITASSNKIKENYKVLLEFRKQLKATTDEYEPYETVLLDVVRQSPETYKSVKELMDRCDSLMLAQVEITQLSEQKIFELENMRKRLIKVANEAALQVLGLKNTLSSLDRLYEAARNEALKWEKTLCQVREAILFGKFNKDRAYDGINNIYRLLCQRRSLYAEVPFEAIEERLDFIKDEVELYREILEHYRRGQTGSKGQKLEIMC